MLVFCGKTKPQAYPAFPYSGSKPYEVTTTYRVHAWCDRPFIAAFDVEAASIEEALVKARDAVHDADADECDQGYPWDEFAVYADDGTELDRHMDRAARLRVHAEDV